MVLADLIKYLRPHFFFAVITSIAAAIYVSQERAAYSWDSAVYWDFAGTYSELWKHHFLSVPGAILRSIRVDTYTSLPIALPSLAMVATGTSRASYIVWTVLLYGTAIAGALCFALRSSRAWLFVLTATTPFLWMAALRGYPDFGGVAIAITILGIYLRRPPESLTWRHLLSTAALLVGLLLFRRWYTFWILGFVLIASAEALLIAVRKKSVQPFRAIAIIGATSLLLLAIFALPMLVGNATHDFIREHTPYRAATGIIARSFRLAKNIGFFYGILGILAAFVTVRDPKSRRLGWFCTLMIPVIHVLFHRVQDTGFHHRLLYAPSYLLLLGAAGLALLDKTRRPNLALGISTTILGLFTLLAIVPSATQIESALQPLTPVQPAYPLVRNDRESLLALATVLQNESERTGQAFALIATSHEVNGSTLRHIHQSMGLSLPLPWNQVMVTGHDFRGDRVEDFSGVSVVALAVPFQLHHRPETQRTFLATAEAFLEGKSIGKAFHRSERRFPLDNGVEVLIYLRARPSTPEEKLEFRASLPVVN